MSVINIKIQNVRSMPRVTQQKIVKFGKHPKSEIIFLGPPSPYITGQILFRQT